MRIARGEWEWPSEPPPSASVSSGASSEPEADAHDEHDHELVGPQLVKSQGAKRIVSRLLVRDPRKRARIVDLWDDVWMQNGFGGLEGLESMRPAPAEEGSSSRDVEMGSVSEMQPASDFVEASPSSTARSLEDEDADSDMTGAEEDLRFYDQPTAMGTEYFEEREREHGEYPSRRSRPGSEGGEEWEDLDGEGEGEEEYEDAEEELNLEEEEEEEEGGCLFDHEGIDSITRREVV
ncbi:hypothetical protein CVT26_008878 [Gymnopilus dilepis]|uniref:Protein kinase domain-containing protein n=1 Tax=Gymnopilus dilepis TaxID=231916 RepID=A0A409XC32_9AGAR|nr:hypothetical protein CVT26_008878 [Gymnopilus dilepis]